MNHVNRVKLEKSEIRRYVETMDTPVGTSSTLHSDRPALGSLPAHAGGGLRQSRISML
jgi:hypothetical protein